MKHIFIVNPKAGQGVNADNIANVLRDTEYDWEIYVTTGPKDAENYARKRCTESDERMRFYACGGDGTIKDVASGIVGFEHASMSCYPVGSGNDFVKYYGGKDKFMDLTALCGADEEDIDLIKVDNEYCINICHFGFDTVVAKTMIQVKNKKIIGGKNAYTTGVIKALFTGMKTHGTIYADGEKIIDGQFLLCTIANGHFVGGAFNCAPKSLNNDGLIDLCAVRPVSRLRFIQLIKYYTKGEHLDNPKFADLIVYRRCRKVEVIGQDGLAVSLDGEIMEQSSFTAEIQPNMIKFAVPGAKIVKESAPVMATV